jgi:hypothetical protein
VRVASVDSTALVKLVWTSLLAVLAVAVVFSLAIFGGTRSGDMRRIGRRGRAGAFAVLGVVATVIAAAIVVVGLALVVRKS